MSRASRDFSKGRIYKITNDYNDDIYVGSTCDTLLKRFSIHKRDSHVEIHTKTLLYKLINEIGFDRFIRMYVYTYVYTYVCMHACMYVC
jgi:hypothetical protein